MRRFLLARGAQALVVIALVATFAFVLVHLAPGDPFGASLDDPSNSAALHAQQMHQWGYDQSARRCSTRNGWATWRAATSAGRTRGNRRVAEVLLETVPRTLLLMGTALLARRGRGLALGTWQAARRGSVAERASNAVAIAALSVPEFLVALAALALPAARWHWFPVSGITDPALHRLHEPARARVRT